MTKKLSLVWVSEGVVNSREVVSAEVELRLLVSVDKGMVVLRTAVFVVVVEAILPGDVKLVEVFKDNVNKSLANVSLVIKKNIKKNSNAKSNLGMCNNFIQG